MKIAPLRKALVDAVPEARRLAWAVWGVWLDLDSIREAQSAALAASGMLHAEWEYLIQAVGRAQAVLESEDPAADTLHGTALALIAAIEEATAALRRFQVEPWFPEHGRGALISAWGLVAPLRKALK